MRDVVCVVFWRGVVVFWCVEVARVMLCVCVLVWVRLCGASHSNLEPPSTELGKQKECVKGGDAQTRVLHV